MTLYPSKSNGMTLQDCFMQAVSYASRHNKTLDGIVLDCKTGIYTFILV
jgi:hypothetical protein